MVINIYITIFTVERVTIVYLVENTAKQITIVVSTGDISSKTNTWPISNSEC